MSVGTYAEGVHPTDTLSAPGWPEWVAKIDRRCGRA
nr:MAG TPA: hypothetical protein [Caudoviricetes sp.]